MCFLDSSCIPTLMCVAECPKQDVRCVLDCGWLENKNALPFVQCQADHHCLSPSPANGKCIGTDETAVKSTLHETGTWYVLKGLCL